MPTIFVLSPHRSGTTSTQKYPESQGLRCLHGLSSQAQNEAIGHELDRDYIAEIARPYIERYDAAADLPFPAIYREVDRMFPKSKFMLIERDGESWARSIIMRYVMKKKTFIAPFARCFYWQYMETRPTRAEEMTKEVLIEIYDRYLDEVKSYFENRECFCCFNLYNPHLAEQLSDFLELPPLGGFPHTNASGVGRERTVFSRFKARIALPVRRTIRRD